MRKENNCIRLDLNESPLPPPREVIDAAIDELREPHRYPDPDRVRYLEAMIAEYAGVPEDHIAVFTGGDEALRVLFERLGGDGISIPEYSFTMYRILARALGINIYELPMVDDGYWWRLADPIKPKSKLIVIDSPNNPTGSPLISEDEAIEFLENKHILIIDEAYYEFHGKTLAGLTESYDNIIVVRTFSKAFALAGLRIGYIVAAPHIIDKIAAKVLPFPLARPSLAAAIAALKNRQYARRIVDLVNTMKPLYSYTLEKAGFKVYKSRTNFLLAKAPSPVLIDTLESNCIRVRKTSIGPEWIRVTVAGRKELETLQTVLTPFIE